MATIRGGGVAVRGLDEFRRELRKLEDKGLTDDLKSANYEVAAKVVTWAAAKASGQGRMAAAAAETLKASRAQARAQVTMGGTAAPFAGGAEFGAARNQPRQTARGTVRGWNQFKEWRGSGRNAGYWLYPSIREHEPQIVDLYGDAIEKIAEKAFPD